MALIQCRGCGYMISDKAEKCPKCGLSAKEIETSKDEMFKDEPKKNKAWLWSLVAGALLCIIAGGCYVYANLSHDDTKREVATEDSVGVEEKVAVEEKKADIVELTPSFIKAIKKYWTIGVFSDGMAAVQNKNSKWGYINIRGEEAIPTTIDAQFVGRFSEGLAFVCSYHIDGSCYVIDKTGKRVFDVKNYYLDACGEGMSSEDMPYFIDGKLYVITDTHDFKYVIYDKRGKKVGIVGYEEGDAYYKNHEIGDYAIISKNGGGLDDYDEYGGYDKVYGLNDLSGKQFLAPVYDEINRKREGTTGFGDGVVLVMLTEFSEEDEGPDGRVKFHYGYADMKGNDTFSAKLKSRCKRSKKEAEEKFGSQDQSDNNGNEYSSSSNEDYSWLNGI